MINCNGQQPFSFVVLLQPSLKWALASQCMLDLYNSVLQSELFGPFVFYFQLVVWTVRYLNAHSITF